MLQRVVVATLVFGSPPKQGGYNVTGQEGGPGVTSHTPENASEGMNLHTLK
jgi:hypothetical protein